MPRKASGSKTCGAVSCLRRSHSVQAASGMAGKANHGIMPMKRPSPLNENGVFKGASSVASQPWKRAGSRLSSSMGQGRISTAAIPRPMSRVCRALGRSGDSHQATGARARSGRVGAMPVPSRQLASARP